MGAPTRSRRPAAGGCIVAWVCTWGGCASVRRPSRAFGSAGRPQGRASSGCARVRSTLPGPALARYGSRLPQAAWLMFKFAAVTLRWRAGAVVA